MIRLCTRIIILTTLCLTGCSSTTYKQTADNVAGERQSIALSQQSEDKMTHPSAAVLIKPGLYVDTTPVSLESQPEWLKNKVVIHGNNMPFAYYSRVVNSAAARDVLTKCQTGLDSSIKINVDYSGSIKGALDLLATKTGYSYEIEQAKTIYWQYLVTRTFSIAFMPGTADYTMGSSGGSISSTTGASGGSDSNISFKGSSLSVWQDLENTIKQMLSDKGKVVVSQSSTSVTISDKPNNVDLIAQYINNVNVNLSRQVYVKIEVIDVALTNDYDWGINWSVLQRGLAHSNFSFSGSFGTPLTITPLTGGIPAIGLQPNVSTASAVQSGTTSLLSAMIQALSQQGKVSLVAQPRVVCMNNQVSAVRILDSQQYIQSVQNSNVAGVSVSANGTTTSSPTITSQITPGTVTTGLNLYVLPKILGDKVYLQINVSLSQNQGISQLCAQAGTSSTSCANSSSVIQSPHVTEKTFSQRSVLSSGETLVLSGFKQLQNNTGAMQLFNIQELGGKAAQQQRSDTIILVTPYILNTPGVN